MSEIEKQMIIDSVDEMCEFSKAARKSGKDIGLVPTMGALHEGHLSLIKRSADENDLTIVSIFVNPIQFDNVKDLDTYPKNLTADAELAFKAGANIIFAPTVQDMYREGFSTFVDMTGITERLCGASRASHFKGVLTVVNKLFGINIPTRAYFGEKDGQQLVVVTKMVAELNMPLEIVGCPTIRESDGLAMSSRNVRLSDEERIASRCLYQALTKAKSLYESGETKPEELMATMREVIEKEPLARIDYAELVDPLTFGPPDVAKPGNIFMLAVFIGEVRLIDNIRL